MFLYYHFRNSKTFCHLFFDVGKFHLEIDLCIVSCSMWFLLPTSLTMIQSLMAACHAATAQRTPLTRCHRPSTIQARHAHVSMSSWNSSIVRDEQLHINSRRCWLLASVLRQSAKVLSWTFRVIDWTAMVVGLLLLQAHRPGICCQTVFVTQLWVSTFLGVIWKLLFCEILTRRTQHIRDFLMRICYQYINCKLIFHLLTLFDSDCVEFVM